MSEEIVVKDPVSLETIISKDPVQISGVISHAPVQVNVSSRVLLLTGEGAPTASIVANVGDEYLDIVSGILYKLYPEGV